MPHPVGLLPISQIRFRSTLPSCHETFTNWHPDTFEPPVITEQSKLTLVHSVDISSDQPSNLHRQSKDMVRLSVPDLLEQSIHNCHPDPGLTD